LIAFATSPGEIAEDGDGENSPYAAALARYLQQPNLSVESMFKQVRVQVEVDTKGKQTPWELSSLTTEFFFVDQKLASGGDSAPKCDATGPYRVVGVEANDALHVRLGPRVSEPSIATLPFNAVGISQERCEGAWCRVRHGCLVGWVAQAHLGIGSAGITTGSVESGAYRLGDISQGLFRTNNVPPGDVLNVRERPHANSAVRQEIPANGTRIEVHECEGGKGDKWCRVTYAGKSGWANARYLLHMEKEEPPE
jgi:SH3-like domain-containing protein